MLYEKGKFYSEFKGMSEGASIRHTDVGFIAIITMPNVSDEEAEELSNSELKYYLTKYGDILYFVLKYDKSVFDIAYNKMMDKTPIKIEDNDIGYLLTIILADNLTGEVKSMRALGMNSRFSDILKKEIRSQNSLSLEDMFNQVFEIQRTKTPTKIMNESLVYARSNKTN